MNVLSRHNLKKNKTNKSLRAVRNPLFSQCKMPVNPQVAKHSHVG